MADENRVARTIPESESRVSAAEMETKDRGMFDFMKKTDEKKPAHGNPEAIAPEFEEKVPVYGSEEVKADELVEEKKHQGLLGERSDRGFSSYNDEEGGGGLEKKGLKENIEEKIKGDDEKKDEDKAVHVEKYEEEKPSDEKKGFLEKMMEKLPGYGKKPEEENVTPLPPPPHVVDTHEVQPKYQGEFDFEKKNDEEKPAYGNPEAIAPEFEQKAQVYGSEEVKADELVEEKKHHGLLEEFQRSDRGFNSSRDEEERGEGLEKKGLKEKIEEKIKGDDEKKYADTAVPFEKYEEEKTSDEKKGFGEKIKEKLPRHGKNPEEVQTKYQGEFDFVKNNDEEKPAYGNPETIAPEFEQKAQVYGSDEVRADEVRADELVEEKKEYEDEKQHNRLLEEIQGFDRDSTTYNDEEGGEGLEKRGLNEKIVEKIKGDDEEKYADTAFPVEKYEEEKPSDEKRGLLEKFKEKLPVHDKKPEEEYVTPLPPPPSVVETHEVQPEKKKIMEKIKDKLPGHSKKPEEEYVTPLPPPPSVVETHEVQPEKKGIMKKIKEKLPGYHSKTEEEEKKKKESASSY